MRWVTATPRFSQPPHAERDPDARTTERRPRDQRSRRRVRIFAGRTQTFVPQRLRHHEQKEVLMAVTTPRPRRQGPASPDGAAAATVAADLRDARFQAFALLRSAFTIAPIVMGLDKFFNVLVQWPTYLAPWINDIVPGSGQDFMYVVGAIEILAGVIVALKPRYGAYVVAAWLGAIIINLLTYSGFYDIALRDVGLMLGALSLARLAAVYDAPRR
jgi:hypothetical protein